MTPDLLRRIALLHGLLAWISAVSLVVITLALLRFRRRETRLSRWIHLSAAAATSLVAACFASGLLLDLPYRVHLRQRLFLASRALGWLFERKAHFSFGSLVFACLALAALLAAGADPQASASHRLRRASRLSYAIAALFALVACVAGTLVATRARF